MSRYTVWDRGMVLEVLARWIVCPLVGHRWKPKMYDRVCVRCRTSQPR